MSVKIIQNTLNTLKFSFKPNTNDADLTICKHNGDKLIEKLKKQTDISKLLMSAIDHEEIVTFEKLILNEDKNFKIKKALKVFKKALSNNIYFFLELILYDTRFESIYSGNTEEWARKPGYPLFEKHESIRNEIRAYQAHKLNYDYKKMKICKENVKLIINNGVQVKKNEDRIPLHINENVFGERFKEDWRDIIELTKSSFGPPTCFKDLIDEFLK